MIYHRFEEGLYYIFRPGMALPRKDVQAIFHLDPLEKHYPDLLYRTEKGRVVGTAILDALNNASPHRVFYDLEYLQKTSPTLAKQFLSGREPKGVPPKELARGIISGILKCDSRGYYFSPTAKELWGKEKEKDENISKRN